MTIKTMKWQQFPTKKKTPDLGAFYIYEVILTTSGGGARRARFAA